MNPASPSWLTALEQTAKRYEPEWIAIRRHLHQHPELSGDEYETTAYLIRSVRSLGLEPLVAEGRGLHADFLSSGGMAEHPRVAIRGDIDALPIEDHKHVEYRSQCPGVMHACGHDVHATIVLGAMQLLTALHRDGALPCPIAVRCIFQPSEETASGARHMIEHHALRNVSSILALHVDPSRPVGGIGLRAGTLTAACDMIEVEFRGSGGHGARPHLCTDPIDACTNWVQAAYRRIARAIDPHRTVTLSVGQLDAGHSANVIPDSATLRGTLRSLDAESRRRALETLDAVGKGVEQETGCRITLRPGVAAPAVVNDRELVRHLREATVMLFGPAAAEPIEFPSMGSEDFSYYLEHVPGAMFRLGVAGPQVGQSPLHTAEFDIDERAIAIGAKLFAATVIGLFSSQPET